MTSRASGSRQTGWAIVSKSCCSTTAICETGSAPMLSTKSPASACSNMSGSQICANISYRYSGVLRDRGLFLNHGITSADLDGRPVGSGVGDFVEKYVFPHGELPHLHVATREMSRAGFEIVDVESLRPHYAKTLEHWSRRLDAQLADAARLVTDRTLRIWRAYLAGSAYGFAQGWMSIYQLLGSRQVEPWRIGRSADARLHVPVAATLCVNCFALSRGPASVNPDGIAGEYAP